MPFIVPGIGYAGLGQQTSANQLVFSQAQGRRMNGGNGKKKRSAVRAVRARGRGAKRLSARHAVGRKRGKRKSRMVKGSAAAKRYMAKLRAMRK